MYHMYECKQKSITDVNVHMMSFCILNDIGLRDVVLGIYVEKIRKYVPPLCCLLNRKVIALWIKTFDKNPT